MTSAASAALGEKASGEKAPVSKASGGDASGDKTLVDDGPERKARMDTDRPRTRAGYLRDGIVALRGERGGFLLAAALVALSTLVHMELGSSFPRTQFITLLPAVFASALAGGARPGYFAAAFGTACAWFLISPPAFSFRIEGIEQMNMLLLFAGLAGAGVWIIGRMRTAVDRANALDRTLVATFEENPDAILLVDARGRIANANLRARELFGSTRGALTGAPLDGLLPERFRPRHAAHLRACMATSSPCDMGPDLCARRADGTEFPVDIRIGAIRNGPNRNSPIRKGENILAIAVVRDLTERKALTEALAESRQHQAILEERQRADDAARPWMDAFEHAPIGIGIADPATNTMRFVNSAFAAQRGLTIEETQGMAIADLYPDDERPKLAAFVEQADRLGRFSFETRHLRKDGPPFPVEMDVATMRGADGRPLYRVASSRDISERKRRDERLQAALREKDILLGEIHHRVKNNLQIIHSLLDMQSARMSDSSARDMLRDCQNRVHSMALIHQTLYGSKEFARVDFGRFLNTLVSFLTDSYRTDPDRIAIHLAMEPIHLPIDTAVPCGLAVNELITNALKHGFPGGARGRIEVEMLCPTPGRVLLSVSDNGVGLRDGLDPDATLGLQLVRLLAQQLRGALTTQRSGPTRFELDFPINGK